MTPVLPAGCVIAVLGAPGTGKTWLANALAQRLAQRGVAEATVADGLDEWRRHESGPPHATITLLMALDLPRPAGLGQQDQAAHDTRIRSALAERRTPYAVIHGQGPERLASAWNAILSMAEAGTGERADGEASRGWSGPCEKCSDPSCEHRLFSELVGRKR